MSSGHQNKTRTKNTNLILAFASHPSEQNYMILSVYEMNTFALIFGSWYMISVSRLPLVVLSTYVWVKINRFISVRLATIKFVNFVRPVNNERWIDVCVSVSEYLHQSECEYFYLCCRADADKSGIDVDFNKVEQRPHGKIQKSSYRCRRQEKMKCGMVFASLV